MWKRRIKGYSLKCAAKKHNIKYITLYFLALGCGYMADAIAEVHTHTHKKLHTHIATLHESIKRKPTMHTHFSKNHAVRHPVVRHHAANHPMVSKNHDVMKQYASAHHGANHHQVNHSLVKSVSSIPQSLLEKVPILAVKDALTKTMTLSQNTTKETIAQTLLEHDASVSKKATGLKNNVATASNPSVLPSTQQSDVPNLSIDDASVLSIPMTLGNDKEVVAELPEYVVIEPSEQATFSSETSASVQKLAVKEGSLFKARDLLVKLDCGVQESELKKAKAVQHEAEIAYQSAQKLKGYGSISEYELVQAETKRDIANADVDKLNSIVNKCAIYAPFNGSVAKVMVNMYEAVKPGDPLIKVVGTDRPDFIVQVPSKWLKWLHVGYIFKVHVSEIDKVVNVKVAKITPVINSVSQTVKIIGKEASQSPDPALQPGMSGKAIFPGHSSDR